MRYQTSPPDWIWREGRGVRNQREKGAEGPAKVGWGLDLHSLAAHVWPGTEELGASARGVRLSKATPDSRVAQLDVVCPPHRLTTPARPS